MSSREDINTGRLIHTCNCGFIDTGHANPGGANKLWQLIKNEKSSDISPNALPKDVLKKPRFWIYYEQSMGATWFKVGTGRLYVIDKGLSLPRRKEIALRIFMDVSLDFERFQEDSILWSWFTDSGFSAEDLTSNVIGFYRAVEGYKWDFILKMCGQTSKKAAFDVYDANFTEGIEKRKVMEFFKPLLFPCAECTGSQSFPTVFSLIQPAATKGKDFERLI